MRHNRFDSLLDTLKKSGLFSADFPRRGGARTRTTPGSVRKNTRRHTNPALSPSAA